MKGKKKDFDYVANFIANCVNQGISSNLEILNKANQELAEIDRLLKQAEELKKKRSKLLDVIFILNK